MNKDALLKLIAETGYNIGYAAKKHLATYDIVEKLPGWIAIISLAAGVFALIVPALAANFVSAIFIVIGIASLFLSFYNDQKEAYATAGRDLTSKFHELRILYQSVKSTPDGSDFTAVVTEMKTIQSQAQSMNIKKQVFMSDWYAHYKFFWQSQTGWMDEQLNFKFIRDKMPLGLTVTLVVIIIFFIVRAIPSIELLIQTCRGYV